VKSPDTSLEDLRRACEQTIATGGDDVSAILYQHFEEVINSPNDLIEFYDEIGCVDCATR
jgi:hypothetical protein